VAKTTSLEENGSLDYGELERLLTAARNVSRKNFGGKIRFYAPSFSYYETGHFRSSPAAFPSISITGASCALNCKHCNSRVLNTMFPAPTPKKLFDLCTTLQKEGAVGCLISGGCLPDGSVPLDRFIDSIAKIKRELALTIVVHTGVIDLPMAKKLKEAGIDAALIDIIGSDDTIREIYGLDVKVADYDRSLKALQESGLAFVPHVLAGLHYGELRGEFQALKVISKYSPSAVITIAFMPIRGTSMETVSPPAPEDVAAVLATARLMMPHVPVVLGCMRPKGKHRIATDKLAVTAGVNAVAFPAKEAIQWAESSGLEITFSSLCCSQIYEDIERGF
jgi:uncharacterized radical SAM superfamily protein